MNNRDHGIVCIATLTNTAAAGLKPAYSLTKVSRNWFEERSIGFRRQYAAKGVNEQVDMLIRTDYQPKAKIGRYAILGNGEQFRITNVTQGKDDDTMLRYTELTLTRMDQNYEIIQQQSGNNQNSTDQQSGNESGGSDLSLSETEP